MPDVISFTLAYPETQIQAFTVAEWQAYSAKLGQIAALADPNADRILFWDDSAGAYAYLTPGTGLTITGTTLDAAGGVTSVFGRTGVVVAASNDYTFAQLASKPTTIGGYGITDLNSLGDARWQPLDADLTSIAALATTSFGRSFLTVADAAAGRTLIGAGTSSFDGVFASLTSKPTTIGGYGITDFNSLGDARWSLLAGSSSIVTVGTLAAGAIPTTLLTGTITNAQLAGSIAYSKLSLTGAILNADLAGSIDGGKISGGTLGATAGTNLTGTAASLTAGNATLAAGLSATLAVASGGTNITSYTIGDLIYASGTTTLSKLADVATGKYLASGGVGVAPSWVTLLGVGGAQAYSLVLNTWASITPGTGVATALGIANNTAGGYSPIDGTATLTNKTLTTPVLNGLPTGTGVASAATASTLVSRDASANINVNNALQGYTTTATAAGTTTLTVASTAQQFLTGSTTQTVVLPVTSTLALGQQFTVTNKSTGLVTVQSSGANTVIILTAGTEVTFTCILTSGTTAASWSISPQTLIANQTVTDGTTTGKALIGTVSNYPGLWFGTNTTTPSLSNYGFLFDSGNNATVFNAPTSGSNCFRINNATYLLLNATVAGFPSTQSLGWSASSASGFTTITLDTGLSRDSAGIVAFGTGAAASLAGSWKATNGTLSGTLAVTGNTTLGTGTAIKNIRHGISGAMVLGTVTVTDTGCTANTRYFFSAHTLGTISIPGGYYASTRNASTSFVITSSQATETSTIDWIAVEV